MTLALLSTILDKAPPQQPVWYNAALIAAAFTATATFVAGRYTAWRERRNRRHALLASLLGEITIIRDEVRAYLRTLEPPLSQNTLPRIDELTEPLLPTEVFDANVGILGELNDSRVVEIITQLYARVKRVNAQWKQYLENAQQGVRPDYRRRFFASHSSLLQSTVRVENGLTTLLDRIRTRKDSVGDDTLPDSQKRDGEDTTLATEIKAHLPRAQSP